MKPRASSQDHCVECGRQFVDGESFYEIWGGPAHRECAKHAEAAEAVGRSGYPGAIIKGRDDE